MSMIFIRKTLVVAITTMPLTSGLVGCRSQQAHTMEMAPTPYLTVNYGKRAPTYRGEVSVHSDDAILRYLAFAEMLQDEISPDSYFVEPDLGSFQADRYEGDPLDTERYRAYLEDRRGVLDLIGEASKLDRYDEIDSPPIYYDGYSKTDPRIESYGAITFIRYTLTNDAVLAWTSDDHERAINRLWSMVRIAKQIVGSSNAGFVHHSQAKELLSDCLELIELMILDEQCTGNDRIELRRLLNKVGGHDPLDAYTNLARHINSLNRWVGQQLEIEEGGYALWTTLAVHHGLKAMLDQLMAPFEEALDRIGEGEIGNPESEPITFPPKFDAMRGLKEVIDQLDGVTIEMLRETYAAAQPDIELALHELRNESVSAETIMGVSERAEEDPTGLSSVMLIPYIGSRIEQYQEVLGHRDELLELLAQVEDSDIDS